MLFLFIWIKIGCMVLAVYNEWFLCMISKWLLSLLEFIYLFCTILICMLLLFFWIIAEGMFVAFLLEAITLYVCSKTIIICLFHWLILYMLKAVCCFFFNCVFVVGICVATFTRILSFVWLWNDCTNFCYYDLLLTFWFKLL